MVHDEHEAHGELDAYGHHDDHGDEYGDLESVRDLAGMPAADASGRFFGDVYGALADAETGLIRYLDIDIHETERHVLVPIGHARVSRLGEDPGVQLRAATAEQLAAIPAYEPEEMEVDDAYQDELLAAHAAVFSGEAYYAHPAFDHDGLYESENPLESATEEAEGRPEGRPGSGVLPRLSELPEFRVAAGESDVRGWAVGARGGVKAGEVRELFVDPAALKVRYVEVALDAGAFVLLPVGYLEIDRERARVRTPALTAAELQSLPQCPEGSLERAHEEALRLAIDSILTGRRRFNRPDFRASRAA
jgi:hypothetical protein